MADSIPEARPERKDRLRDGRHRDQLLLPVDDPLPDPFLHGHGGALGGGGRLDVPGPAARRRGLRPGDRRPLRPDAHPLGQLPSLGALDRRPLRRDLLAGLRHARRRTPGEAHLRLPDLHPGHDALFGQQHALFRAHGGDDARCQRAQQPGQLPLRGGPDRPVHHPGAAPAAGRQVRRGRFRPGLGRHHGHLRGPDHRPESHHVREHARAGAASPRREAPAERRPEGRLHLPSVARDVHPHPARLHHARGPRQLVELLLRLLSRSGPDQGVPRHGRPRGHRLGPGDGVEGRTRRARPAREAGRHRTPRPWA